MSKAYYIPYDLLIIHLAFDRSPCLVHPLVRPHIPTRFLARMEIMETMYLLKARP